MVCHNAPFDRAVWEHLDLPPAQWFDTLPRARAAGLPGKLDALGERLEGRGKDPVGKKVLKLFIDSPVLPHPDLPIYDMLRAYCARDVELLETVYKHVHTYGEPDVIAADLAVNERGVPVDREYLASLRAVMAGHRADAEQRLKGHFNPRSPKQVQAWLASRGYCVPSVGKEVLQELDVDEDTSDRLADRTEAYRAGLSKADAGLESLDNDGRLRDQFAYCASPQGRWASYGMQLHNVPKSEGIDARQCEPTIEAVNACATLHSVAPSDVTNAMLRHSVRTPDMLVADFSAIEPRVLYWLADDQEMLAVYADPTKSAYLEMGSKVFGRAITKRDEHEYFISKQIVIGCGYGMGHVKFDATLAKFGVDASSVPGGARFLVQSYRRACPKVVQLWANYNQAAMDAVQLGCETQVGHVHFGMRGRSMVVTLPSGRPIWYRDASIEPVVPAYKHLYGMPLTPEDTVVYTHPVFGRRELYGGKIAENVDQGTSRDFLADKLVALEQAGFCPFMHAHDEVACERGRFAEFMEIVSSPPSWAAGFPLAAEGYRGPMWAKDSSGWEQARYLGGRHVV